MYPKRKYYSKLDQQNENHCHLDVDFLYIYILIIKYFNVNNNKKFKLNGYSFLLSLIFDKKIFLKIMKLLF